MIIDMNPLVRRLVIQYAAKENLDFGTALECLVVEGVKAEAQTSPAKFSSVNKDVEKLG